MAISAESAVPTLCLDFREGRFVETSRSVLDGLFGELADPGSRGRPLVIHFHGGLVPEAAARERADRLDRTYRRAGAVPLFVVWHSGFWDSIRVDFARIVGEPLYQRLVRLIAYHAEARERPSFAAGFGPEPARDVAEGDPGCDGPVETPIGENSTRPTALLTADEEARYRAAFEADAGLREALAVTGEGEAAPLFLSPSRSVGLIPGLTIAGVAIAAAFVLRRVVRRRVERTDHGVYPTVVEEVVRRLYLNRPFAAAWGTMKDSAADAFGDAPGSGGIELLRQLAGRPEALAGRRIVLVGHSAGAYWICHWLRRAATILPAVRFEVVLLAPACDFPTFQRTLDAAKDRIAAIRVFAMDDAHESRDRVGMMAFPRSLLYLVSGVLEEEVDTPLVGMERYYTNTTPYLDPAITAGAAYLSGPGRLVWSATPNEALAGHRSQSQSHGGFDEDPETLESLGHILRVGF